MSNNEFFIGEKILIASKIDNKIKKYINLKFFPQIVTDLNIKSTIATVLDPNI